MKRKDYGTGSIEQRGGRWAITYWHNGKRFRESTGSTERQAAVNLLKQRLGEVATGRVIGPVAERLTLRDLLDMVEADHALNERKSTAPTSRLIEYFGEDARALDLTHDALTRYASKRRSPVRGPDGKSRPGAAANTVKNELAVIGRGLALAYRSGKLQQRPVLPTMKVQNARSGFVEPADFGRLLAHLPPYLQPLAETAYITGWRRGELIHMRWRNVDWAASELRLERGSTKSGEPRVFPVNAHPRLATLLREQRERVEAIQRERDFLIPWVFCHDDGRAVAGWWQDSWATACERAGLPGLLFHDLRRSAVRNLVRAGVSETVAMRLTGHKTASVFRRYNIVSTEDLSEAVARLAEYHEKPGDATSRRVLAMGAKGRRA